MNLYFETFVQYLGHIISIIVAFMILSGRREARATLTWLLVVIVFPYIGALLYFLFGNPTLKIMVDVRFKKNIDINIYKYYSQLDEFERSEKGKTIVKVTHCMPTLCYGLELFSNARDKYNKLIEDIKNAEKYIFFEYYIFRQDETGKYFIDLLAKKASEGVKVYFLYDGVGAMGLTFKNTLKPLKNAGGKTGVYLSPFSLKTFSKLNFRNHRKIVIIDGKICYTGGINIGNEYVGEVFHNIKWYDVHIRFCGDAVHEVEEVFAKDWYFATGENLEDLIKQYEEEMGGDTTVQITPSGPDQKAPLIYNTLFTAISMAKHSIDIITPYLIPDQPFIELLRNLALRGVKIRLIVPGYHDHPLVSAAGRSFYEELMETGVQIYETKVDVMVHAKVVLIDGDWCTVGSTNMDTRSFKLNFELNVVVYSMKFAKKIEELIEDYLSFSIQKNYDEFIKRNYFTRVYEGICRAISPVL